MKKVVIIDTSILCVWLRVPGKETCGPDGSRWTYDRVRDKIEEEVACGSTLIMPLATIIETGNHIAQSAGERYGLVEEFARHLEDAIDGKTPWAAFTQQSGLLAGDALKSMLGRWRETALSGQSLGDAMIVDVANCYAAYPVEIFTGDEGLKAYEPRIPVMTPRRRMKR